MRRFTALSVVSGLLIGSLVAYAQPPFGGPDDQRFGDALWDALEEQNLVGDNAIMAWPYEGNPPHGDKLVTFESEITVNGQRGEVIVKHNYGPEVSLAEVSNNPQEHLVATTVMFRRDGYDPENNNWFWAKWMADGSYDRAPNGGPSLVGSPTGCITCHGSAPGGDMVFLNDSY